MSIMSIIIVKIIFKQKYDNIGFLHRFPTAATVVPPYPPRKPEKQHTWHKLMRATLIPKQRLGTIRGTAPTGVIPGRECSTNPSFGQL